MKNLILLYHEYGDKTLHIKNYTVKKDTKDGYIIGEKRYGYYEGVLKNLIGKVSDYKDNYYLCFSSKPMTLPYMEECYWKDGIFIFLNKNKYDKDPIYYQKMVMNYREE